MVEANSIMVFIELRDKKIAEVSLQLLGKAAELAEKLKVKVSGVCLGYGCESSLGILQEYGCSKVYYADDRRLEHFTSVPYAKVLTQLIQHSKPSIVLFGATTTGRDVAPRVASALRCGLTADCTDLQIGDYETRDTIYQDILLQIRPAFGGNMIATIVSPESSPCMATVREGVMPLIEVANKTELEVVSVDIDLNDEDFPTEVIELIREEKRVNLTSSNIVVSAGMGAARDEESMKLVKELAELLGGVVGSSRPVVDALVLHKDHQVGQTGTTVRPNLYIACGISGQIQHRAGMSESKRIIAINTDPDAPIFNIADYGIVGDVKDVIPRMIKAYKGKM